MLQQIHAFNCQQVLASGYRGNMNKLFPSSAAVAQVTVNHLVAGSNPASGVFLFERLVNRKVKIVDL